MSIPAAWYPDPHDTSMLRWWDGSTWTEHRHALPTSHIQVGTSHAQHTVTAAPAPLISEIPSGTLTPHTAQNQGAAPMTPATSTARNLLLSLMSVFLLLASGIMLYVSLNYSSLSSSYLDDLEQLHETEQRMSGEVATLNDEVQRLEDIANGM